jgi:crossover junction endodeoxyribonuclease RusA
MNDTEPRSYLVTLPIGLALINSNESQHPGRRARIVRALRAAATQAARENQLLAGAVRAAAPGPVLAHAHIIGVLHPHDRRKRDPANWYPSFKAAVDGIVDAGVLSDDDSTRVIGPDMRIGSPVRGSQIVLHIREITPDDLACAIPCCPAAVAS